MSASTAPMSEPFVRDRPTWAVYLLMGFFGYLINLLGPVLPYLRTGLNLSFSQAGLHTSAFAVGMLVAGFSGAWIARRIGSKATLWGGAAGMGAGAVVLSIAPIFPVSLAGALLMGMAGTLTLGQVFAALARLHPHHRARTLTEANAMASLLGILVPLMVGATVASGIGWRVAAWFAPALLAVLWLAFGRTHVGGAAADEGPEPPGRLPGVYWAYWVVLLLVVAIEFSVSFWVADFLHGPGRLEAALASSALSAFFLAMLIGRLTLSAGLGHVRPDRVVLGSLIVVLAGFSAYWLIDVPWVRLMGLFATGLGVANLYPVTLSMVLATASDRPGLASARASLASGVAIILAPFLLGALADATSLNQAQGFIVVLAIAAALGLLGAGALRSGR